MFYLLVESDIYSKLQDRDDECVYIMNCLQEDINEKKEYCFVLETFEKELNEQKMDYQFYFKCKKICQQFGIGQLEHANAILEQQKTHSDAMTQIESIAISVYSMISATLAVVIIGRTKFDYMWRGILVGVMWMMAIMIYAFSFLRKINLERHAYYYSLICDEIEKRNKEGNQHK